MEFDQQERLSSWAFTPRSRALKLIPLSAVAAELLLPCLRSESFRSLPQAPSHHSTGMLPRHRDASRLQLDGYGTPSE